MKVLKKIVIVLAGIVGLAVLISFFLPSEVVVQRSTEINASAATVYAQVNNLKSWEAWDPWHAKEPEMGGSVYSGPEAGVDAKHCWDSENPDIGKGCLTIIESDENSSIKTMLEFDDHAPGYGNWSFEETDGVTSVTWAMNMDMGMNVIAKFMGLMMDGMLGPDFESGLAKLKEVAESIPVEEPPANLANAEYVKVESQPIYSIKDSTDTFGIGAKLGELYGELTAYLSELGIESTGQPLCIWHEWNPEGYSTLEAAIPVAETGEGKGTRFSGVWNFPF